MKIEDCFYLGTITKMHGLSGHVLIKLDTDDPSSYYNMESVLVDMNGQPVPFFIEEIDAFKPDVLRVLFKDVEAGMITGKDVYLPLSQLPPLSGKKFYYHEVIGFKIRQNGKDVGEILSINDNAAQPYFNIASADTSEQAIPIIDEWIVEVNRPGEYIEMNLPDGIMDL